MSGYITNHHGDYILGLIAGANPAIPTWLSLLELDPTAAGNAGQEFAGNGYTRQPTTWTTPGNKTTALASEVRFDQVPDGTVRWMGVHNAASGGSMLFAIQRITELVVASNQVVVIPAADIVLGPL